MASDPFAEFRVDETPSDETFARLKELTERQEAAEKLVLEREVELKKAQEALRQVREFDLPKLMDEIGLDKITTKDGIEVEVVKIVRASIGDRKVEAFAWLIKNGHGGLIKRTVEAAFGVESAEQTKKLADHIRESWAGADVRVNMKVEPASLTAFVKEMLEQGKTIPVETFGVYDQKISKIKRPE